MPTVLKNMKDIHTAPIGQLARIFTEQDRFANYFSLINQAVLAKGSAFDQMIRTANHRWLPV
jgi:hypothetical protein